MNILTKPYTMEECIEKQDDCGFISGVIEVGLNELIGDWDSNYSNVEEVMDMFCVRLIDNILLSDISYEVVGVNNGNILIEVSGSVEDYIAWHTEQGDDYTV